ncbi:MAG: HPr family phosphocarrier protein [Selenomonadaceae bacterium]|nr:HPr family phosphocarrier protein [Selenomonadaceae bacterium]
MSSGGRGYGLDIINDYVADTYYAEATTTIQNKFGMHARPCSLFVQKASSLKSRIYIKAKGRMVDGKSILMLMSMGLAKGTEITIGAVGANAEEDVKTLIEFVDDRCHCGCCW